MPSGLSIKRLQPTDDPAIALYTKLGVREDVLHFDIPVGPDPAEPGPGRA